MINEQLNGNFLCSGTIRNILRGGGSISSTLKRSAIMSNKIIVELWHNKYDTDMQIYEAIKSRDSFRYLSLASQGVLDNGRKPNLPVPLKLGL